MTDTRENEKGRKKAPHGSTGRRDRASVAKPPARQSRRPVLDERVPGLLLDSLASVQAALASAPTGLSYSDMRKAAAIAEDEKRELTSAALSMAAEHPAFFSQHRDVLEFAVVWAGMHAARVDHLFALRDAKRETGAPNEHACTGREAVLFTVVILAPLLIFILFQVLQSRRGNV
jgi:hypothetical protein